MKDRVGIAGWMVATAMAAGFAGFIIGAFGAMLASDDIRRAVLHGDAGTVTHPPEQVGP